ncbi:toll/interleukin-1 receptor domain-containing protein [candidate division KSB1 bacterium]|nr:toll/interleukin-1 receptor domain-containing protein [candidate division KSB1 bacterium]
MPRIFISYSHKDEEWKDRLVSHLAGLQQQGYLEIWVDKRIKGGQNGSVIRYKAPEWRKFTIAQSGHNAVDGECGDTLSHIKLRGDE